VVRGGRSARSRLLLRVPWQLRARSTRRAARGSAGFQACRKRRAALFPARGYAVLPPIAPSFHGFRCFGAESSSEQPQIRAILKEPPHRAARKVCTYLMRRNLGFGEIGP
jgi:hypothetical protein